MSDFPSNPNFKEVRNQTHEWTIPSIMESSMGYHQKLEKLLLENGWDEREIYRIGYAFHELLVNAIVHGNLGLKKPKGGTEEDYAKNIAAAERLPENQTKIVQVKIILETNKIIITIQDQGKNSPEFWKIDLDGIRTGNDTSWQSGRGIQVSEKFTDQVIFEKKQYRRKSNYNKRKSSVSSIKAPRGKDDEVLNLC